MSDLPELSYRVILECETYGARVTRFLAVYSEDEAMCDALAMKARYERQSGAEYKIIGFECFGETFPRATAGVTL